MKTNYENKNESVISGITNDIKTTLLKKGCEDTGKVWKRNCPKCKKEIIHTNFRSFNKSLNLKRICKSCNNTGRKHSEKTKLKIKLANEFLDKDVLNRLCPVCNQIITYKSVKYRRFADKHNKCCRKCFIQKRFPFKVNYYRKCGICGKQIKCGRYLVNNTKPCSSCYHNNRKYSPSNDTRHKLRMSFINRMIKTGKFSHPSYNESGCKLIDEYGEKYGYSFQHALNGGEFYIKELGYWVDGYDKKNNVVLEIDESFHFDETGCLKQNDLKRMNEIINHLKCKFIRIKYETGKEYIML